MFLLFSILFYRLIDLLPPPKEPVERDEDLLPLPYEPIERDDEREGLLMLLLPLVLLDGVDIVRLLLAGCEIFLFVERSELPLKDLEVFRERLIFRFIVADEGVV